MPTAPSGWRESVGVGGVVVISAVVMRELIVSLLTLFELGSLSPQKSLLALGTILPL